MSRNAALYANVFIIATCGLTYELLAGTLASYVLGDSVTQFSLVIGLYLSALGAGAWLSRYIERGVARAFIEVELAVALLGGCSAGLLFLSFGRLTWFPVVLYGTVFLIGVLVGLELPLLMRLLRNSVEFKDLVSRVLAVDYVGALAASLLFPMFCVPKLGLVRTSLLFGMLNGLVALWGVSLLADLIPRGAIWLRIRACAVLVLLAVGAIKANAISSLAEEALFNDPIVFSRTTPYQRIVATAGSTGFQLFLNGNLQFSSVDEYRYHEALVHPALACVPRLRRVTILGGGDGLALREVLRRPEVASVTLVDIDPAMTELGREWPPLVALNGRSFHDPRVTVVNEDAMIWLEQTSETFDAAIVDFPDPNTFALGKLYTRRFFSLLRARLASGGACAVQCTSPFFARQSYWCIIRTMEAAGLRVSPYHATVPSFGEWGFALVHAGPGAAPGQGPLEPANGPFDDAALGRLPAGLRFLDRVSLPAMFVLPVDMQAVPVEINRLDNQALVRYYEAEWNRWK